MRSRLRAGTLLGEVGLAALLCVLDLFVSWDRGRPTGGADGLVIPVYAAVGYAALVWRRRLPGWVLVAMVAHSLLAWIVVRPYVPTLGVWLALYTVSSRLGLRRALLGLALAFLPTTVNAVEIVGNQAPEERLDGLIVATVMGTLANLALFGLGRWARWTVWQRGEVARRAAADAVSVERARIARELHDIVAHSVTLMLLQAGGAARLLRADPDRAETALRHVDDLGQQAIVELRRMLDLLATPDNGYEEPDQTTSLARVDALVDRMRTSDMRIEFSVDGAPAALDAGVDLCAYRIVQEALTNAARYGDLLRPIELAIQWRDRSVEISVVNSVPAVPQPRRGTLSTRRGLISMRERAHAVGGRLDAVTRADGRFSVVATLPVATAPVTRAQPVDIQVVRRMRAAGSGAG